MIINTSYVKTMKYPFGRKDKLDEINDWLLKISADIIKAGNHNVHKEDFYILSVINRAISLNKAFLLLLKKKNTLTAISVVRLQLDNVLRLNAIKIVSNRVEFLNYFFDGKPINKYKDGTKTFHDKYLATKLEEENPGTLDLYNFLCNFIHFSDRHFEATKAKPKNENALFRVVIGNSDVLNNEEKNIYKHNMINISNTILKIGKEWANTKNL